MVVLLCHKTWYNTTVAFSLSIYPSRVGHSALSPVEPRPRWTADVLKKRLQNRTCFEVPEQVCNILQVIRK